MSVLVNTLRERESWTDRTRMMASHHAFLMHCLECVLLAALAVAVYMYQDQIMILVNIVSKKL